MTDLRQDFDVPPDIAYFNTASLSPSLRVVLDAGRGALARRSRPWDIHSADWFTDVDRVRELYGRLIGADGDSIAIVPATSYGMAVAARNLRLAPGSTVLVLAEEYPSGIYTWRAAGANLLTVTRQPGQTWTEAILDALDERVAVVSVPNVHWTDGSLIDLTVVARRAREVGARLVVDASQSAGAVPFDVGELRPDFLVTVGYKWLLGPFGVGYLYVAPEHRDGVPVEQNWIGRAGSEDFARLVDYRDDYQPGARRFDVGERTKFELMPMAIAALTQVSGWGVDRIAADLAVVTRRIAEGAAAYGFEPTADPTGHMLGLRVPERLISSVLPALEQARCYAAFRGDSLRISPHLHTNDEDVTRLLDTLAKLS
jgi:selenocysteine lyase/cysteine desulfurase